MNFNSKLQALLEALSPQQRDDLMQEAVQLAVQQQQANNATDYTTEGGIVRFVRDVLFVEPTAYQERILRALVRYKRVCVRAPHGAGKTTLAAWVVLWGMLAFDTDVKIPTTASVWRQLEEYLWPEIRKWAHKANIESVMRVLTLSIDMGDKRAFAVASDTPSAIEGAHASTLIYIFDEAKAISSQIFEAAEGAFSGAGESTGNRAYALAISTPGETSGTFYDIQTRRAGYEDWHAEHITLEECIAAGRIDREFAEQRKKQYGENSPVYLNRYLGEFATNNSNAVVPLSWVEAANERYEDCRGRGDGLTAYGLDVARFGEDATTTAKVVGRVLESLTYNSQQSTMETVGRTVATVGNKSTPIGVDVIGIGAGVYDRLKELGFKALAVNAGESAKDSMGNPITDEAGVLEFFNKRSQLWWMLREALNPESDNPLALPPDDRLTGDLTAPLYSFTSNGRIKVESKDDIRARIGRSTDAADALALALEAVRAVKGARLALPFILGSDHPVIGNIERGTKSVQQADGSWIEIPLDARLPVTDEDTIASRRIAAGLPPGGMF